MDSLNQNHTIFLDESGNTGSRFLSKEQPNLIICGWIVPDIHISALNIEILNLEKCYSNTHQELKGNKLSKHTKGQNFILDVIDTLSSFSCLPLSFLVEKKYMICAKIVETYFDPEYNNNVKFQELWDLEKRQNIAEIIYKTDSSLISNFSESYKNKNIFELINLGKELAVLMKSINEIELCNRFFNVIPQLENNLKIEFKVYEDNKKYDSLNLPMIFAIFQFIQNKIPFSVKLIHDNIDSFADVYKSVYDSFTKESPEVITFLNNTKIFGNLSKITKFEFEDSKTNPLLRASDYIVSSNAEYIKRITNNQTTSKQLSKIAFRTIGLIYLKYLSNLYPSIGFVPDLGITYSSDDWINMIFKSFTKMTK